MAKASVVKMRWARKLATAKFFVVLTDKESVIALDGVDPNSFSDILALQSQAAEIEDFMDRLKDLRDEHDKALDKLGGKGATTKRKKVAKTKVKAK